MSYRSSESTHSGVWIPQEYVQSDDGYALGVAGYRSRAEQAPTQAGSNASYYQHQFAGSEALQYSYGASSVSRAAYMQGTSDSSSGYPVQTTTDSFGHANHINPYINTPSQYSQQHSQSWMRTHTSQVAPRSQNTMQQQHVSSPAQYSTPQLPGVAPRMLMGADASYSSSSNWHTSFPTPSESTSGHSMPTSQPTESGAEYVVPCPYNCGTVLTGVHAVGNMTRHLKSQNCVGSGKEKPRYICPVKGCDKRYIRSDGLKVHLRKRHNISQPNDKAGGSDYAEGGYGYS